MDIIEALEELDSLLDEQRVQLNGFTFDAYGNIVYDDEYEERLKAARKKNAWIYKSFAEQEDEIRETFRKLRKQCPTYRAFLRHKRREERREEREIAAARKEQRKSAYEERLKRNAFGRLMHLWNYPGKECTNGFYVVYRHMNYWYNDPSDPYNDDNLARDDERWDIVGIFKTETEAKAFKNKFRDEEGGDDHEGIYVEYIIIHN